MNTQADSAIEKLCIMLKPKQLTLRDGTIIAQSPHYVGPIKRKYIELILTALLRLESQRMISDAEIRELKAQVETLEGMRMNAPETLQSLQEAPGTHGMDNLACIPC